jgi:hypothetical protein
LITSLISLQAAHFGKLGVEDAHLVEGLRLRGVSNLKGYWIECSDNAFLADRKEGFRRVVEEAGERNFV